MEDYTVYNSPFRSSIFDTSKSKTVREVYRERIKQIYYSQFPSLLKSNAQKQINSYVKNIKIKNNDKNDANEEKEKEKEKDKENENIKIKKDENIQEKKDEKKEIEEQDDKNIKNDKNEMNCDEKSEEEAILINKDTNESEENIALKKLNHALNLLDIEYFGREQQLYLLLFNKYNSNHDASAEDEYLPQTYSTPLISEILMTENETIECSECLQSYNVSEFAANELECNGYYLACCQCAPDRNNIISLKWHETYKSDSVIFGENGYIAKVIQSNHRYCVAAQRPVVRGLHCWRWCTKQYQTWFLWGISHCKKYTDNSYGNQGVYGIAGSKQSYKNGQCSYDVETAIFFGGKTKVLIDMLLDLNKGELRFKIPGNDSEAKMVNIPKDNLKGWVPHCNIHYANANVQIKKIPTNWYGKMPKRVKFY